MFQVFHTFIELILLYIESYSHLIDILKQLTLRAYPAENVNRFTSSKEKEITPKVFK